MTHYINTFNVIISYFLCCKGQTKNKKTIHIVDSSIATRLLCILSTCILSPQQLHFKHTALVAYQGSPYRKVALKTSLQDHLTKQQFHLGQARQSSKLIFEISPGISLALRRHNSNSWRSHFQSPIHKRAPFGNIRTSTSPCNYILVVST